MERGAKPSQIAHRNNTFVMRGAANILPEARKLRDKMRCSSHRSDVIASEADLKVMHLRHSHDHFSCPHGRRDRDFGCKCSDADNNLWLPGFKPRASWIVSPTDPGSKFAGMNALSASLSLF